MIFGIMKDGSPGWKPYFKHSKHHYVFHIIVQNLFQSGAYYITEMVNDIMCKFFLSKRSNMNFVEFGSSDFVQILPAFVKNS